MNINITKLLIPTHQTAYIAITQLIIIKTRQNIDKHYIIFHVFMLIHGYLN